MVKAQKSTVKPEKSDMKQLLESIKKEMTGLTSLKFSTITGVGTDEDTKAKKITLELVERSAIPDSMDLLGIYEVLADEAGNILTFKRVGMRKRSDTVSGEEF
jgi:hypothetical protein